MLSNALNRIYPAVKQWQNQGQESPESENSSNKSQGGNSCGLLRLSQNPEKAKPLVKTREAWAWVQGRMEPMKQALKATRVWKDQEGLT